MTHIFLLKWARRVENECVLNLIHLISVFNKYRQAITDYDLSHVSCVVGVEVVDGCNKTVEDHPQKNHEREKEHF